MAINQSQDDFKNKLLGENELLAKKILNDEFAIGINSDLNYEKLLSSVTKQFIFMFSAISSKNDLYNEVNDSNCMIGSVMQFSESDLQLLHNGKLPEEFYIFHSTLRISISDLGDIEHFGKDCFKIVFKKKVYYAYYIPEMKKIYVYPYEKVRQALVIWHDCNQDTNFSIGSRIYKKIKNCLVGFPKCYVIFKTEMNFDLMQITFSQLLQDLELGDSALRLFKDFDEYIKSRNFHVIRTVKKSPKELKEAMEDKQEVFARQLGEIVSEDSSAGKKKVVLNTNNVASKFHEQRKHQKVLQKRFAWITFAILSIFIYLIFSYFMFSPPKNKVLADQAKQIQEDKKGNGKMLGFLKESLKKEVDNKSEEISDKLKIKRHFVRFKYNPNRKYYVSITIVLNKKVADIRCILSSRAGIREKNLKKINDNKFFVEFDDLPKKINFFLKLNVMAKLLV